MSAVVEKVRATIIREKPSRIAQQYTLPSRADRATVFWGHHHLLVEQLAGITGQGQFGLQSSDARMGGRQFISLHT